MDRLALASLSKINLHLRIGSPGADGFHPLRSWMITTDLYDWIEFTRVPEPVIHMDCNDPSIPTDASNLIIRAATEILNRVEPEDRFQLHIQLAKSIPAGAGLGGGSGNAATTLRAVNQMLGNRFSDSELAEIALTLGSDVPFFLGKPSAIATGRGEALQPVPVPKARFAVLILPPFPIPTAQAYRVLDQLRPVADECILDEFDVVYWARQPAMKLLDKLENDLEPAAFAIEPRLGELRSRLESFLERIVRMSGSGSTLFTLFDTLDEAAEGARSVEEAFELRVEPVELGVADIQHPAS